MLKVKVVSQELITNSFPMKGGNPGRWYTVEQQALLFREGEEYPDKFQINLSFSDDPGSTSNVRPLVSGDYTLNQNCLVVGARGSLEVGEVKDHLKLVKQA